MANNKSFHLRWNNHLQNLRTLFESIYNEQNLVDVTLSCSDGLLRAHKLVLSACSPYFEAVFRDNPCKHPVVILKGIQLQEMQTLLEYMYIGSVDVMEDDLETLLNVANELQVKGLVQKQPLTANSSPNAPPEKRMKLENDKRGKDAQSKQDKQWRVETLLSPDPDGLFYAKNKKSANKQENSNEYPSGSNENSTTGYDEANSSGIPETDITTPLPLHTVIKIEEFEETNESSNQEINNYHSVVPGEPTPQEKAAKALEMIEEHDEDATFCLICNKNFHSKQNLRRHLQTHTGEKPHRCEYCELSFLRLSHLQRHIRVHTGERPYSCNLCPKQFSRSDKLKQHVSLHHTGYQSQPPKIPKKPRGRPRLNSVTGAPCDPIITTTSASSPLNSLTLPRHFTDITVSPVTSS